MCEQGDAANAAQRYEGGGKIDWALPPKDELNAPCYHYTNRDAIGGFVNNENYWSSSQYELHYSWQQDVTSGNQNGPYNTFTSLGVRPVRAFWELPGVQLDQSEDVGGAHVVTLDDGVRVGRPQQAAAEVGAPRLTVPHSLQS